MRSVWQYILVFVLILMSSHKSIAKEHPELPFRGEILKDYDEESVKARCDATDLQPLEGIWYYPDERMSIVIERCDNTLNNNVQDYRLVLIDTDDMELLPGTVIGYCLPTVDGSKYKLWIYSEQKGSILENPQMCVATLDGNNDEIHIERSEVKMKVRVNFSRFLPKLLKGISIVPSKKEVKVPEGFKKIYPKSMKTGIRYL